jgi:hypothetical protein
MTSKSPAKIPRKLPPELSVPLKRYASIIGELVWSYNLAQSAFEILFSEVVGNFSIGRNIWHASGSDNLQIQMLVETTNASKNLSDEMKKNIIWAARTSEKLRSLRNDAVHSASVFISKNNKYIVSPSQIGTKDKRFKRLHEKDDLKKHFRTVKDDLYQLGQYVNHLWPHVVGFDLLPPLPDRPKMQSIKKTKK